MLDVAIAQANCPECGEIAWIWPRNLGDFPGSNSFACKMKSICMQHRNAKWFACKIGMMTSIACKIKRFACKIGISQSICMQTVKLHANGDFDRFCLQMGHFRFCTRLRFWSKIGWNRFCNVKKPILLAHRFCWEVYINICVVVVHSVSQRVSANKPLYVKK